jgi:hypothetical protein
MLNLTQKRVRSLHPESGEMEKVLDSYKIDKLFHFTCVDNLELIAKCGGIWSKEKLQKAWLLRKVITGGNEISKKNDIRCKNWDKVSLSFCYGHPMAYNILERKYPGRPPQSAHICYLVIDQEVALWDGVLFAPTNATKSGTQPRGGLEGLNSVKFELIRKYLRGERVDKQKWEDMKEAIQAECLVPDEIPLECIKSIVFISKASRKEGKRLWESGKSQNPNYPQQHKLDFEVNEWYFYNLLRKYYNNLPFSLVDDFVLTPEKVNQEIVNSKKLNEFEDKREFSKSLHSEITLLVKLYAKSGSKARVEWRDKSETVEFDKEGGWWLWSKLDISRLNEGDYSVEFYLDDVRWFKAPFKIKA